MPSSLQACQLLIDGTNQYGMSLELLNVLHHLTFIPNDAFYGAQVWDAVQQAVHTLTAAGLNPAQMVAPDADHWQLTFEEAAELKKKVCRRSSETSAICLISVVATPTLLECLSAFYCWSSFGFVHTLLICALAPAGIRRWRWRTAQCWAHLQTQKCAA